jgi:hypothetical protein
MTLRLTLLPLNEVIPIASAGAEEEALATSCLRVVEPAADVIVAWTGVYWLHAMIVH